MFSGSLQGQHHNQITAVLNGATQTIQIRQHFIYVNSSDVGLSALYFNDWNHAYANKNTALAQRFAEAFKRGLHLAKEEEQGRTTIKSIVNDAYTGLDWNRMGNSDLIRVALSKTLAPGDSVSLFFTYNVKLPSAKFTTYGFNNNGGYYLKDWYLTPAVFDGNWRLYDNLNLDDLYTEVTETTVHFTYPEGLFLATNFDERTTTPSTGEQYAQLQGTDRKSCEIILTREERFTPYKTPSFTVTTDLEVAAYDTISRERSILNIVQFLTERLGTYPHNQLLVSEIEYKKVPLYGLGQLPRFIRPYDAQFQFELMFLKTAIRSFLRETLFLNPRAERWVHDALSIYLMMQYVEVYYPHQKLTGKLSKLWGFRNFHLAQMDFNDQYALLSMFVARKNIDQALTTRNDSLIKFNQKIAHSYKAGLGLSYLSDYVGAANIANSIQAFYNTYRLKPHLKASDFRKTLERFADKDIDWFFEEYVATDKKIDFTITKGKKTEDSIVLVIKNKRGTKVPISLSGLRNDTVVSHYWFSNIDTSKTISLPNKGEERLVLNYNKKIPEINQRDNWKTLNGFLSSNKKLKFQFFKDTEDPYYYQIFYVPTVSFNVYDGLSPGLRLYNKPFLERPFTYDISPAYSFLEQSLIGSASLRYRKYHNKTGLYLSTYSFSGATSHFQVNSRFTTLTPAVSFSWRPSDLISNRRQTLLLRYRSVTRNSDESIANVVDTDPDYGVLNARYTDIDNDMLHFTSWFIDAQHASDFSKLSFALEYRKLFQNNRQLNLRLFAGAFLRNQTDSDFFSFALDRPTDYLFDLPYLGRSEDTGFYSQQIIIAEGGFKSRLENPFADDWMVTTNASTSLWRWIEVYGDLGFLKNKEDNPRFVYDSGVRLNLVTDYFELYFPVYSNNGWEITQPHYAEHIRFVATLSPRILTGLFSRRWF